MQLFAVKVAVLRGAAGERFEATFAAAATSSADALARVYDAFDWSGWRCLRMTAKPLTARTPLTAIAGPLPARRT